LLSPSSRCVLRLRPSAVGHFGDPNDRWPRAMAAHGALRTPEAVTAEHPSPLCNSCRLRRLWLIPLFLVWGVALAAGTSPTPRQERVRAIAAGEVNASRLHTDASAGTNWMLRGRTYSAQRFSPLKQIDSENIERLGVAWSTRLPSPDGFESTPIVVDGVIYMSGTDDLVEALDAGTGRMLWRWRPANLDLRHLFAAWTARFNRGVAVWGGKVFIQTGDCRLFALSAGTGREIWMAKTCDPSQGYGSDGAPLVARNMVLIGNGGADVGAPRGYVSAYDTGTGRLLWRFYTVPGNPAKGFEQPILKSAARTWKGHDWWKHAGGNVWDSIVYDPTLNQVYFGTDSATPWDQSKGDALFTCSIIAVDASSGRYVWHYQEIPDDAWDYDATTPIILADLTIAGRARKVLMQAARNGFFYVIDRKTGELLSATPFVRVNWASRIDLSTGRPVLTHGARYYLDRSRRASLWPGVEGAHNWQAMSFSPLTGLVYIPALNAPSLYYVNHGELAIKLYLPPRTAKVQPRGRLIAWDPILRKARWFVTLKFPYNGGTLVTAGNLVFEGTAEGVFTARRATDGRLLWSAPVVSATEDAPVTYLYRGRQYVLLPVGASGDVRYLPEYGNPPSANGPSRLIAFSLGAHGTVPNDVIKKPPQPEPPRLSASASVIVRGGQLYESAGCIECHGAKLDVAPGGTAPDLRYLPHGIYAEWNRIVLGGELETAGMPSFHGDLSPSDSQAIRAYVIEQAWDLYESRQHQIGRPGQTPVQAPK
jgi:quinohemoprotein ethanol dehydrogenase